MKWIAGGKRLAVVTLLAGLGACGGGGSGTVALPVTPEPVPAPVPVPVPAPVAQVGPGSWIVMGSSTAAGAGAAPDKSWVALTQAAYREHKATLVNIAKGGTVTYEGMSAAAMPVAGRPAPNPALNIDQALARKPVLLIVSYPTNDTALGYSVDETVSNLLTIRNQALAVGVHVIVISTQPRNLDDSKLGQLNAIDQRLAASIGPCFVDVRQALAGADNRLASEYNSGDGVHPNEAGHQVIAARLRSVLDLGRCIKLIEEN